MSLSISGLLGNVIPRQQPAAPTPPAQSAGESIAPAPSSEGSSNDEAGVTYIPSSSQGEAVTYSPDQSNSVSSAPAAIASNDGGGPARQVPAASTTVERSTITKQVAAHRSVATERISANDNDGYSSPRVAELMQAFIAQYGRNDMQVLDLL